MKAEKAINDLMFIRQRLNWAFFAEAEGQFAVAGQAIGDAVRRLHELGDDLDYGSLGSVRCLVRVAP